MFSENLLAMQTLWNCRTKMWKFSDFWEKRKLLFASPKAAIQSSRYQSTILLTLKSYRNVPCCACFQKLTTFFHAIIGNRRLTDEVLTPTFCHVEKNFKLSFTSSSKCHATDLDAVTPNDFLLGTACSSLQSKNN